MKKEKLLYIFDARFDCKTEEDVLLELNQLKGMIYRFNELSKLWKKYKEGKLTK